MMQSYISSGFGFLTGNPFCPKAALKGRNSSILTRAQIRLKSLLLLQLPALEGPIDGLGAEERLAKASAGCPPGNHILL